jgi:hypothetical protein
MPMNACGMPAFGFGKKQTSIYSPLGPGEPTRVAAAGRWSRVVVRTSRAIAVELVVLTMFLGWRRYRRRGFAGI